MRMAIFAAGFAAALISSAANATSTIGTRSSGTTTFTVEIPPVAAALAAFRGGAVGLWTVNDSEHGLMIKLPDTMSDASDGQATIYNGAGTMFTAQLDSNPFIELSSGPSSEFSGLRQQDLLFRRTTTPTVGWGPVAVTMVIAGI